MTKNEDLFGFGHADVAIEGFRLLGRIKEDNTHFLADLAFLTLRAIYLIPFC